MWSIRIHDITGFWVAVGSSKCPWFAFQTGHIFLRYQIWFMQECLYAPGISKDQQTDGYKTNCWLFSKGLRCYLNARKFHLRGLSDTKEILTMFIYVSSPKSFNINGLLEADFSWHKVFFTISSIVSIPTNHLTSIQEVPLWKNTSKCACLTPNKV